MKKIIAAIIILVFSVAVFVIYSEFTVPPGKSGSAQHSSEHGSSIFSDKEINSAIKAVKKKFRDFEGCTLTEIYFDEEKSKNYAKGYIENGKGSQNGVTENNVLVLLSSFTVGETGGGGSLNSGGNYTGWNWILIRDNENSEWRVDDWGY